MQSAPLQVVVIPFHTSSWSGVEYCLLRRGGPSASEAIFGAGEQAEGPATVARCAMRDAGVAANSPLYQLESMDTVPVTARERRRWSTDRYAVLRHTFGVDVGEQELTVAGPDADWAWMDYPAAHDALAERSLQNALWELHERIHCRDLRHPVTATPPPPVRATVPGPVLPNLRDGAGGAVSS